MERGIDQDRLDEVIAGRVGFLRNAGIKEPTWHRLATLRPEVGFCGADIMVAKEKGGYDKDFVKTEAEIPQGEKHCRWCWPNNANGAGPDS